jgi:hypothetical protein
MISVRAMDNNQLMQNFAIHKENMAIIKEIERRAGRSNEIRQLIFTASEKLREMEEVDSDMLGQNTRCHRLAQEYLEKRNQLLQKMADNQMTELCGTAVS